MPDAIKNAPELLPGLQFVFEAFGELNTTRAMGQVEGPIPWTAIREYAEVYDVRGDEFDEFNYLIRAMDLEYMSFRSEELKRQNAKLQKPKTRTR